MQITLTEAKARLDAIINKARVDLYKPIHIAEVLRRSRLNDDIDVSNQKSFQNPSLRWRDAVTMRLLGKASTSSARYQHDVWNATAMPPAILSVLNVENKKTKGAVERYIYMRFSERQGTVAEVITLLEAAVPETFQLRELLKLFVTRAGIRRSVDKAYEIVTHSLLETIVTVLGTTIRVSVPVGSKELLDEFSDLAQVLLGLKKGELEREESAHVFRVGVTNAADRGLDMWANFGPAVQVKHLTLNNQVASQIVDQVESDRIVIVCRDADAKTIQTIAKQIGWGRRICGIITESNLIDWYERCMRGRFSQRLAKPLLRHLVEGFKSEFPQNTAVPVFLKERGYTTQAVEKIWRTETEIALGSK